MNMESFKDACKEIDNFADKLGEIVYDEFVAEDNPTTEIGKYIIIVFKECETERDFWIAEQMLIAICGWGFDSLVNMIKKRDEDGYFWESI